MQQLLNKMMNLVSYVSVLRKYIFTNDNVITNSKGKGYQHNSKTNYRRNSKFGILHVNHTWMLLKKFYEDWINSMCTGEHKRILIHYGLQKEFLVNAI